MIAAHRIALSLVVFGIGSPLYAAKVIDPSPAVKNVQPGNPVRSASNALPRIVEAFGKESYMRFNKEPVRVDYTAPTARTPFLKVELSSPTTNHGFAGSCIEKIGAPIDLRSYQTMDVDLEVSDEAHLLQVKLERRASNGPDGQFRAHDGALPASGRQTVSLALAGGEATLRAVQRLCFAMEANGFQGASARSEVKVYAVRFNK